MKNKKIYIISFALLAFLLFGHIINSSIVCLIAGVFVYGSILICDSRTSTGLLFFFFPFSYLFAYNQYSLCIFMAVAYILKSVSKGKIFTTAFYTIILLAYSLLFADYDIGNVKLGTMIPPILISLLIFVCEETEETDYLTMIELFKNSFIISAVIGFFKDEIPSISLNSPIGKAIYQRKVGEQVEAVAGGKNKLNIMIISREVSNEKSNEKQPGQN